MSKNLGRRWPAAGAFARLMLGSSLLAASFGMVAQASAQDGPIAKAAFGMALQGRTTTASVAAQVSRLRKPLSTGRIKQIAAGQVVAYSAKATTYSASTYTAAVTGTAPSSLTPGQQISVNFSTANPGPASLAFGNVPAQAIKLVGSNGLAMPLTGYEIVPAPMLLTWDGSEYILGSTVSRVILIASGSASITAAGWAAHDSYLVTGTATLTLPCSSTLSTNGGVSVAAMGVTATIAVSSGCSPTDYVTKNAALGTATSQAVTQGASFFSNASGGFFVSGQ